MTTATPVVPGRFCWQELATRDAAKALDFYGKLLGWTSEAEDMGEAGVYHRLHLDGKHVGGLYEMKGEMFEGVPPHWTAYVKVVNVDDTKAKVEEHGGTVMWGPHVIPDIGRMLAFVDPQGAALCAFEDGGHTGKQVTDEDMHAFCWTELMARDMEVAQSFYTKVFGWGTQTETMSPEVGDYTLWMQDGVHVGGGMTIQKHWGDVPSHWLNYVTVAKVDEATAKAEELGAKVVVPKMAIPGTGSFTMIEDPTGAHLCLFEHLPKGDCPE